jgi:hypothetical protein
MCTFLDSDEECIMILPRILVTSHIVYSVYL